MNTCVRLAWTGLFHMATRQVPLIIALLFSLSHPGMLDAQAADVIRGRISDLAGKPIKDASVIATSVGSRVRKTARTDSDGSFSVIFPNGDGSYSIEVNAIGYAKRSFNLHKNAGDEVLIADARLSPTGSNLEAVRIVSTRQRPSRNENSLDIGGTQQNASMDGLDDAYGRDPASVASWLAGVQFLPGIDGQPNGFSVFGLPSNENSVTLNGLGSDQLTLPRDAAIAALFSFSPYDVSQGGFSAGRLNFRTRPGTNMKLRSMSISAENPALQWSDPTMKSIGRPYSTVSAGTSVSGPIRIDRAFYNFSIQATRRTSGLISLIEGNRWSDSRVNIDHDSLTRLTDILAKKQIPLRSPSQPSNVTSNSGSLLGSLDWSPRSSTSGNSLGIVFNGNWNLSSPAYLPVNEIPSHSGSRSSINGAMQVRYSGFVGPVLMESSAAIGSSVNKSEPFLSFPNATVRIASPSDGNSVVTRDVGIGGNPFMGAKSNGKSIQGIQQFSWYSNDNRHFFKLRAELRHESISNTREDNARGTFVFQSLEDLENDRASAFFRTLSHKSEAGSVLTGGVSIGDLWRKSQTFQIQYGVRADFGRFGRRPDLNSDLQSIFSRDNSSIPGGLSLSPRFGFMWRYGQKPTHDRQSVEPRAMLRGGVGIFQNAPTAEFLDGANRQTGLPNSTLRLTCVGAATPSPEWIFYQHDLSEIPVACADGSGGKSMSEVAPSILFFEPTFKFPRSLRSNLQWSGDVLDDRFRVVMEATLSVNMQRQGFVDLNVPATSVFNLADEANRPVFTNTASIVASSGSVSNRDNRVAPGYSRVMEFRSNLRNTSKQLQLRVLPVRSSGRLNWTFGYTFQRAREQTTGFESSGGTPWSLNVSRSPFVPTHSLNVSFSLRIAREVSLFAGGVVHSGLPFTPLVQGDINGDGYSNDRAFIFGAHANGVASPDPAITELLSSSPAADCLRKQIGRVAERNSCSGPWTTSGYLSLQLLQGFLGLPKQSSLTLQLSNPVAAADMLFHGTKSMHGWGQYSIPDSRLLIVRGFDHSANRFLYDVNPRFGRRDIRQSALASPVSLSAVLRIDLGQPRYKQEMILALERGRRLPGNKLSLPSIENQFSNGEVRNIMRDILEESQRLSLSIPQADSIATMSRKYSAFSDSLWSAIYAEMATLPDDFARRDMLRRYDSARALSVARLEEYIPFIKSLLTERQRKLIPERISVYLNSRYLERLK